MSSIVVDVVDCPIVSIGALPPPQPAAVAATQAPATSIAILLRITLAG